jgi:2-amino-4-ketopentanoate thiolase alpha subunit
MLNKGSYVEIQKKVLSSEERAHNIPEETRKTPLNLWAKGFLEEDSEIGKVGKIVTINGRHIEGIITELNPSYTHDFGEFVPEILYIGTQAKAILWGDEID